MKVSEGCLSGATCCLPGGDGSELRELASPEAGGVRHAALEEQPRALATFKRVSRDIRAGITQIKEALT